MASPDSQRDARPTAPVGHETPSGRGYGWFVSGVASWFGAWGFQQVLFSWLVVGELRAPAEWVGVTQTSAMLPAIFLLLVGGATADRLDPRRLLVHLHALAALPPVLLALAIWSGKLSIPGLIGYGLCMGTIMAFSMPARDSLLSRVAGPDLMRAVTGNTIAQFGSQGLGALLAGAARWIGSPATLLLQAGVMGLGAWTTRHVPDAAPIRTREGEREAAPSALHEITEGLRFVLGSPLRGVMVLLCGVGILFMGPFLVIFPLLVRDVYGGDVRQLSVVMMLFPVGTILGSSVILLRGGIRRKGLSVLISLACGALALVGIGQGLPFPGFLALTLAWGVAGSVFMNSSRTLFQQAAPPESRARVLSVSQLGFMAAAPVGSLVAGFASARLGALDALVAAGTLMLLLVASVATLSGVPRIE